MRAPTLLCSCAALLAALLQAQSPAPTPPPTYDPLAVPAAELPPSLEFTVHDRRRKRDVPLRVYLPTATDQAPLLLFSHGLGGSRDNNGYLGRHWSARGYAVVFLQHPGSDESVWREQPLAGRMAALRDAANGKNLRLRIDDVPLVLDALTRWNADDDHPCHGRFDLEHVGMTGHSFGALTTQCVSGQAAPWIGTKFTDPRIDAALPMSPSNTRAGSLATAFGSVAVPWLLMTGTADSAPIGDQTPASRREVFPHLPKTIDRYELVLDGAEHNAFGERALPGERRQRNPNHHRAILAISTAFWDTHLRGDPAARAWLHGEGCKQVLEPKDLWQVGERAAAGAPK